MRTIFRLLLWLGGALLALALAAAGLGWHLLSRSLPDYGERLSLAGLEAPVEIVRDANAVPHILATTEHDAFFAMGLVHAQERLWQMELSRRGAQGRLAELFGAAALPLDRRLRALSLHAVARAGLAHQSAETRAALDAYSDGVNAWIAAVNEGARGRGAPEFFLFGDGLAPWTPEDSLAILKVMALRLTGAAEKETRRARLLRQAPPERLEDLFPLNPDPGLIALPTFAEAFPDLDFPETRKAEDAPRARRSSPTTRICGSPRPASGCCCAWTSRTKARSAARCPAFRPFSSAATALWPGG